MSNYKIDDEEKALERKKKMLGEPYAHDPDFRGPSINRSCTDIICLIVYGILALASIVLAIFAFSRGNPSLLIYPTDSQGKVCGYGEMESRPNLLFHDILDCVKSLTTISVGGCPTTQQCVEKCPTKTWSWLTLAAAETFTGPNAARRKAEMVCVDTVDFDLPQWSHYDLGELVKRGYCAGYLIPQKPVLYRCIPEFLVDQTKAIATGFSEKDNLTDSDGKPLTTVAFFAARQVYGIVMNMQSFGERVLADLRSSWRHIVVFSVIALVVAFLWILLLRFVAAVIIWLTIVIFLLIWLFGAAFCYWRYFLLTRSSDFSPPKELSTFTEAASFKTDFDDRPHLWLVIAIIATVILIICVLVLIVIGSRIKLAVKLFQETSTAMVYMPSVLIWPFFPFALQLATVTWAAAAAFCIASLEKAQFVANANITKDNQVGIIKLPESLTSCDYTWITQSTANLVDQGITGVNDAFSADIDTNATGSKTSAAADKVNATLAEACRFLKYGGAEYAGIMQLINLFMFFWNYHFVAGFGIVTLAGAFGSYYWAFKKPDDIPKLPLFTGLWRTIRYHMGSVAFGSLLIAIVMIIRVILNYVMGKLKQQRNYVAALVLKCIDCLFSCIEKLVKFMAKRAYIMVAVHAKNFCASAMEAWQLIMRNAVRAIVLSGVTKFLMILSKLMVTGLIVVTAYFYFHGEIPAKIPGLAPTWPVLNYFFAPVVIVGLIAYAIASICFHVYEIGVETMFLSFLEDCERNDGSEQKPYFMSKNLAVCLR